VSGRSVNARTALAVTWPGAPTTGWTVGVPLSQLGLSEQAILSFSDPTGHLTVSGTLADVSDWAGDLLAQVIQIQVQLEDAGPDHGNTGGSTDDRRTDRHDHW
jgi:hypothetical protein